MYTIMTDSKLNKFLKKIKNIRHRIKAIWFFGSRARKKQRPDSDYDLLVVVDKRDSQITDVIYQTTADMLIDDLVDISVKLLPIKMYEALKKKKTPFITNVLKEGIRLG